MFGWLYIGLVFGVPFVVIVGLLHLMNARDPVRLARRTELARIRKELARRETQCITRPEAKD